MNKIGDIKTKIKFAFFPVKMTNRLKGNDFIWFKKYINIFEYKQMTGRRMLPIEGIASEDGKAVYDKRFSKYKTYTYEKWVRVNRYKK